MAELHGTVTYYNKRVLQFAGVKQNEDGSWHWKGIVHHDDLLQTSTAWETSVKNVTPYQIEHRIMMQDGSYRWHLSRAYPYNTDEGVKWYGTATDVHDQKVLEMNLESLVKDRTLELQRSNDDLQQFAHVASHDLKEPLRKIKTFSYKLQDEFGTVLNERGNSLLNKIIASSDRMFSMINGVLTYASISSAGISSRRVDLNEVIRAIEIDLELLIQEKRGVINFTNLPGVTGHPDLIYQLFYNLLNNSLKFTRPNTPVEIAITAQVAVVNGHSFIEITLADNGIGFENQYAEQIFDTFTRLHSKDKYEGSGLGLAMCQRIVERHGGTIAATGTQGLGATFKFTLPS
jgi:PAS domain S-box-containing protein